MELETVKCNFCGSDNFRKVYEMPDRLFGEKDSYRFQIVECCDCGLGFVNPRPKIEDMGLFYPKEFYDPFEEQQEYHEKRYSIEAEYLKYIKTDGKKRLLDVGCANGGFPLYVKNHFLDWEVEGLEISESSKDITEFFVYKTEFDKIEVNEPTYDAITAWAVMEHVHNPMAYIKKASEVLKPGGIFIFLVPNFNSLASKKLYCEDIPRHLYFFNPSIIKKALEENGLFLEKTEYTDKIYQSTPLNFLVYFTKKAFGKEFTYEDSNKSRQQYFEQYNIKKSLFNSLKYALTHPIIIADRLLLKYRIDYEIKNNKYGTNVFVARKK